MKGLTKAEEQVMQAVWSLQKGGNLKDIVEAMPEPKPHHNTVATLLKILAEKEYIGIDNPNRFNFYYPLITKDKYSAAGIQGITEGYFEGSYKNVVSFLASKKKISVKELEEIIQQLKKK